MHRSFTTTPMWHQMNATSMRLFERAVQEGQDHEDNVNYEPRCTSSQSGGSSCTAKSEGKDNKGMFPAGVDFIPTCIPWAVYTGGLRNIFETVLNIETPKKNMTIKADKDNIDGLNFLAGKDVDYVNKKAMQGTVLAHTDGGVPNLIINIPEMNSYWFGSIVYFFEKACVSSGYLLGVNPCRSAGVEAYNKEHVRAAWKPGMRQRRQ